jgi:hypothetical protein
VSEILAYLKCINFADYLKAPGIFSMRIITFIVIAVIFLTHVRGQNEISESERILIKTQGIRMKEQMDFKYNGNTLSSKGIVSSRTTYDKDGRIIELINYKSDTSILNIATYAYNADGQRTEYSKYKGNKTSLLFKQTTQYNAAKQKISETGFNGADDFRNEYNYDSKGNLVEIRYYIDKKLDELRRLSYKGNRTDVQVLDASGNLLFYLNTQKDIKNRVIEESRLDNNQKPTEQTLYTYDSRGNLIIEEKKYPVKASARTEYIYDNSGKLQEIYFTEGEEPRYLKQSFSFAANGSIMGEFWKNSPSSEQSFRKYSYDRNGRMLSTDCFFASYRYKVLNKFVYQTY